MVAVLTCMLFAAISGSGPATVAAIGGIMIPEMDKAGYPKPFCRGAALRGRCAIGVIIPPSLPMVNYAVAAGGSCVHLQRCLPRASAPASWSAVALMVIVAYFSSKKNGYGQAAKQFPSPCTNVGGEL